MAYYDTLTGLPNRDLMFDRLNQAISYHNRSKHLLAVCYIDLDGFKDVNDQHGHDVGDRLLVALGERLTKNLRDGDTLARIGGDEFVVLLTSLSTSLQSEEIIRRMLEEISTPFDIDDKRLYVSAAVGLTLYPTDHSTADTLLRHADQAMYKAKVRGGSQLQLYQVVQDHKRRTFRETLEELQHGLKHREFVLYYQPRVDLRDGTVVGVEALIRWRHPQQGLLAPSAFLPLIEGTSEEIAVDEWVVKTAVEQLSSWRKQGLDFSVSVNISPNYIQKMGFVEFLRNTLADYPPELAKKLEIEMLETASISSVDQVAEIMRQCLQLGVSFSLDDFGTGYSSLTYFHRLPVDILKIDQNFVRSMIDDANDLGIVEGVIQLSKALNRPVVSEGVETVEQGLLLMYLGCYFAQGYGIAKPMPAEVLPEWVKEWQQKNPWQELSKVELDDHQDIELKVAIFSHQLWQNKIIHYVQTDVEFELPALDAKQCQFSHWYKGIGEERYGSRGVYPFILPRHERAHEVAEALVALVDSGQRDKAIARLDEFDAACQELIAMLRRLGAHDRQFQKLPPRNMAEMSNHVSVNG